MQVKWKSRILIVLFLVSTNAILGQNTLTLKRLKYGGGGDWYNDPSALINLCHFVKRETSIQLNCENESLSLNDEALFTTPFLFLTGHGRISISETEAARLRLYLLNGGFLYADDDYGMDVYFRAMMKKVFPEKDLVELPFDHGIYSIHFPFPNGLPKIHEHDNKPARGFGIFNDNQRLMVFYTYETNLSDGWADQNVHNNTDEKRLDALKMGVNILVWALLN